MAYRKLKIEAVAAAAEKLDRERHRAYDSSARAKRAGERRRITIVAEGDSWFSYLPAHDILANLRNFDWGDRGYDVHDRAKAGALLNDMIYGRDMVDTFQLLQEHRPDVFLFSGGGNDIAGPELFCMLFHKHAVDIEPSLSHIDSKVLDGIVAEIFGTAYQHMIAYIRYKADALGMRDLPIVLHGYDYAIPDGRGYGWFGGAGPFPGPWLDPSLSRKGYDRQADVKLRQTLVNQLIDAFNAMLARIAGRNRNVHYVDLRKTLSRNQWANELHPDKNGFAAVTRKIEARLRQLV